MTLIINLCVWSILSDIKKLKLLNKISNSVVKCFVHFGIVEYDISNSLKTLIQSSNKHKLIPSFKDRASHILYARKLNLISFCILKKAKTPCLSDLFIFVCKTHGDIGLPTHCNSTSGWEVLLSELVESRCMNWTKWGPST